MNYTQTNDITQLQLSVNDNFFMIPSFLDGFHNTHTTIGTSYSQREVFCLHGTLDLKENDSICPKCGKKMHINGHRNVVLRHLCFGSNLSCVEFDRVQHYCNNCNDDLLFGPVPTVLMKCERCGCEMELDAEILGEMAEADGDDKLSCICMKCGRRNMYQVK